MRPDVVKDMMECQLADMFAVDVKGPWAKYPALTGNAVSEIAAQANLARIFELAKTKPESFYFRCTQVPGLTEEDLAVTRGYLPLDYELTIQEYVPPRRNQEHAKPNHEERRPAGNVVH